MYLIVFVIGICIGSFLNVLIDRLPKKESVLKGRSYCESCKKRLAWFDLIPILSFVFLRGKCRFCRSPISFYYPAVEIITGILFVLVLIFLLPESIRYQVLSIKYIVSFFYYLIIVSSLIVIFFTDLKYGIIPDKVLLPAILASLAYLFTVHNSLFIIHLLSGAGAFLFFLLLYLLTRTKGMGFGDVKLAFLMGLVLGFPAAGIAFYVAFLTGAAVGVILVLWGKKRFLGGKMPFGPFLVLGTILSIFLETKIINLLHWLRFW